MKRVKVVLLITVVFFILASCGTSGGGGSSTNVSISNFSFDPASVTIKVGQSVTWTNKDSAAHTVASDAGDWTSQDIAQNQTFSHTFDQAGTFTYHCSIHPNMKGTIVVNP